MRSFIAPQLQLQLRVSDRGRGRQMIAGERCTIWAFCTHTHTEKHRSAKHAAYVCVCVCINWAHGMVRSKWRRKKCRERRKRELSCARFHRSFASLQPIHVCVCVRVRLGKIACAKCCRQLGTCIQIQLVKKMSWQQNLNIFFNQLKNLKCTYRSSRKCFDKIKLQIFVFYYLKIVMKIIFPSF